MQTPALRDSYDSASAVSDALKVYYLRSGFDADGGASQRWVRFAVGPLQVIFPNTAGRRRAIRHHDLHHLATGYQTTVAGEGEIGAWELASGCGVIPVAWVLNSVAMAGGLFVAPRRVFRAYIRGLHSENTYRRQLVPLESQTLGHLRDVLGLDRAEPDPTLAEGARFGVAALRSVFLCGAPALALFLGPALATTAWDRLTA